MNPIPPEHVALLAHASARRPGPADPGVNASPSCRVHACLEARQFEAMRHAFLRQGGWVEADGPAHRLRPVVGVSPSWPDHRNGSRALVRIDWRGRTFVPLFQFDRRDMSTSPAVSRIAGELEAVFDDWELALWFASPNGWLDGTAPVDHLADDEPAVLQAARADRFVARG